MNPHVSNKIATVAFLGAMAEAGPTAIAATLDRFCHEDCRWEIFHPFDRIDGNTAAAAQFWGPLRTAFPDYEQRIGLLLAGEYEGREQVSSWGHVMGSFEAPWLGIPANQQLTFLRFGFNAIFRAGKIAKAYILLDIVDVMRQAGYYPFRRMPGSAEQWPFPGCEGSARVDVVDAEGGARTMAIVIEMQLGLPKREEIAAISATTSRHSHHWHDNMNWYGPAGIGSMRRRRGFRDYHGALFLQAFPDRSGIVRDHDGPEDAPGHYVRLGDGQLAVTGGWPSLYATHLGSEWLGLPPSGRKVEMRVADWYRLDRDNRIVDNWVMIDVPHIVRQMGLDIFHDLQFIADPGRERWPAAIGELQTSG